MSEGAEHSEETTGDKEGLSSEEAEDHLYGGRGGRALEYFSYLRYNKYPF